MAEIPKGKAESSMCWKCSWWGKYLP